MNFIGTCKCFLSVVVFIPFGLTQTSYAASSENEDKVISQVAIMTVLEKAALTRELLGLVFAPQTQSLSSEVTAVVVSERKGMGTRVSKGDIIVRFDSREAQAHYELAKSEVVNAQINIQQKTLNFDRAKQIYVKKLSSRAEYDKAELILQKAKNSLLGYQAKLEVAKINLEKHNIIAPFDGLLVSNSPVVGLRLSPGDKVVEVLNNDELRVKAPLSRAELLKVQSGQAKLVVHNKFSTPLTLLYSAPKASDINGMFQTEFSNSLSHVTQLDDNQLDINKEQLVLNSNNYSGQAIKLQLIENKIHIPDQAIAQEVGSDYVMAIVDERVVKVAVSDLAVGQQVVVIGPSNLLPGDNVKVLPLEELM